jgi:hypothetical protein
MNELDIKSDGSSGAGGEMFGEPLQQYVAGRLRGKVEAERGAISPFGSMALK